MLLFLIVDPLEESIAGASQLVVSDQGDMAGSVSGGCVEGAVVTEALEAMGDADRPQRPRGPPPKRPSLPVRVPVGGRARRPAHARPGGRSERGAHRRHVPGPGVRPGPAAPSDDSAVIDDPVLDDSRAADDVTPAGDRPAPGDDIAALKALLLEHLVIFLPDQSPTPEAHIAFGRHFGHLEGHPNLGSETGLPGEIFQLKATSGGVADEWHTDLTFQEKPALMSILHMVTCPDAGGDTMWTSLYAAYNELSDPMKAMCDGLTALHDALPHNKPEMMTIHPVVRVHPETGKRVPIIRKVVPPTGDGLDQAIIEVGPEPVQIIPRITF